MVRPTLTTAVVTTSFPHALPVTRSPYSTLRWTLWSYWAVLRAVSPEPLLPLLFLLPNLLLHGACAALLARVLSGRAAALTDRLPADKVIPPRAPAGYPGSEPMFVSTTTGARVALAEMLGRPIDRRRQEVGELVVRPWLLGESP